MKTKEQLIPAQKRWQEICEDWQKSGLSQLHYCEERNISLWLFYKWRRKLSMLSQKTPLQKEWQNIYKDWEASSVSVRQYCKDKKIYRKSFYEWKSKINVPVCENFRISDPEWKEIIKDWEKSELTSNAYCLKNGLSGTIFSRYQRLFSSHTPRRISHKEGAKKWAAIIEDWKKSGLNQKDYCLKKDVALRRFYIWRQKFGIPTFSRTDHLMKQWKTVIEDWERSNLNAKDYCKEKKISLQRFYWWRVKINDPAHTSINLRELADHWKEIIKDWEASGLSPKKYCQNKEIGLQSFYGWRIKIDPLSLINLQEAADKWRGIFKDWEESGISPKEYCFEKGISIETFHKWRVRLNSPEFKTSQKDKWKKIIRDWETSELNAHAYCTQHRLYPALFYRWKKKFSSRKRQRPSPEEYLAKWTKIMEDWKESGLSGFTYCQRNGIEDASFRYWKKKLNPSEDPPLHLDFTKSEYSDLSLDDYFVSVPFGSAISTSSPFLSKKVEITLSQGHHLYIEGNFEEQELNSWLASLVQQKNDRVQNA